MSRLLFTYLTYASLAAVGTVVVAIAFYVLVSFAMMRAHVEPRPWGVTMRELLRETLWVVLTQPLLPYFYFRGHAMGGDGPGDAIILVHGYFQNRVSFVGIGRALARAHVGPVYGFNYPWLARVEKNAERLSRFVERVCKESGRSHVSIVAHSLGGIISLEYMHTAAGAERVRRCVTIASPHGGVAWQGPILGPVGSQMKRGCEFLEDRAGRGVAVPTLSIFSTHDNIVHPPHTSQLAHRGGRDFAATGPGHLAILFDTRVIQAVVGFLRSEDHAVETAERA